MSFHVPRINLRLWINMLRRAGFSLQSAEEIAHPLNDDLAQGASNKHVDDRIHALERRLMLFMLAVAAIAITIAQLIDHFLG